MSFITLLLEWYHVNKRALPWRIEKSVYRVWLSEIILQQTRVNQGLNYFNSFVKKYPKVNDLAVATEQEVLNLWQGLGYYSRARNLHKTAQIVTNEMEGVFPMSYEELKKLPGIGPYTAAAIASICYDEKVPAIDGNAYRVYSRLFAIDKDISDSNAHRFFFDYVQRLMPNKNTGAYNEAVMELGATVCIPKNPQCTICPLSTECNAYETGAIAKFPVKSKKVKVKNRYFNYFFIHNNQEEFIITKRTDKDVWFNLNDFPLIESKNAKEKVTPLEDEAVHLITDYKHILTHQRIYIKIYAMPVSPSRLEALCKKYNGSIIHAHDIADVPFPKPIYSFLHERYPNYI